VASGPRIGINGEGGDPIRFPWRLWVSGDSTVSCSRSYNKRFEDPR
jgi:DNA-3-methyladenine glycosylase